MTTNCRLTNNCSHHPTNNSSTGLFLRHGVYITGDQDKILRMVFSCCQTSKTMIMFSQLKYMIYKEQQLRWSIHRSCDSIARSCSPSISCMPVCIIPVRVISAKCMRFLWCRTACAVRLYEEVCRADRIICVQFPTLLNAYTHTENKHIKHYAIVCVCVCVCVCVEAVMWARQNANNPRVDQTDIDETNR